MTQHPKWQTIVEIAKRLGAGEWAIRKWSQRNAVPPKWQIDIVRHSGGQVSISDFDASATTNKTQQVTP